jgi:hypothetical protein
MFLCFKERDNNSGGKRSKDDDGNKQIMRIRNTRGLCSFISISTHAAELNHVNVASSFPDPVKAKPRIVEGSVSRQTQEASALQIMQDFEAQQIANTLHIMAKQRYTVTGPLLLALERLAETMIRGLQLTSSVVASTLWAFATMRRSG